MGMCQTSCADRNGYNSRILPLERWSLLVDGKVRLFWYEIDITCAWTIIYNFYTGTFLGINIVDIVTIYTIYRLPEYDKNDLDDMILLSNNNLYTYSSLLT